MPISGIRAVTRTKRANVNVTETQARYITNSALSVVAMYGFDWRGLDAKHYLVFEQGARRFSELRADIPMISSKVLTTRLRELESKGAIARKVLPTSPPSVEYELTALGAELMPAIQAIVNVSHRLKSKKVSRRKAA